MRLLYLIQVRVARVENINLDCKIFLWPTTLRNEPSLWIFPLLFVCACTYVLSCFIYFLLSTGLFLVEMSIEGMYREIPDF